MPNERQDPGYRPGGTSNFYEGMLPYYNEKLREPTPKQVTPLAGLVDEKPSAMDKIKSGAKKAVDGVKSFNRGMGLTDQTLRGLTTAAQLATGAGSAATLMNQIRPNPKVQKGRGRAQASYPQLTAAGMLGAGMGSGLGLSSSSSDIPASP